MTGTSSRADSEADGHPRASYAFREDSYYTDDQSDDCYGGDYGEANTDLTHKVKPDSDDEYDSDDDHQQHCNLHADPLATHCNALTRARKKCSYKAKLFKRGSLPVCATHQWNLWSLKAGKCQAVEKCGRVCNRYAPHAPPYHLCAKHEKGTDTLPCGIMSLPTELHLMIFRYLFPKVVPVSGLTNNAGAVLRVNRAFHSAASSIVYDELQFKASVDHSVITLLGRLWETDGVNNKYTNINKALCQAGAQRIRKLHVEIRFASRRTKIKGIGTYDIGVADYELYQVRDAVRKLVELLWPTTKSQAASEKPVLKQVEVRPAPGLVHHWQPDEVVAAIFFVVEPFVALGPIATPALLPCPKSTVWHSGMQLYTDNISNAHKDETYRRLRKVWMKSMKGKLSTPNKVRREGQEDNLITREYHKIEQLWALIQKHESSKCPDLTENSLTDLPTATSSKAGWLKSSFQGIERVLHIARTIDMNIDHDLSDSFERMGQIREAITKRWVNAHRQQQRSASAIAACIGSMSHSEDPKEIYPDAFDFETPELLEHEAAVNYTWPELGKADIAPRVGDTGVTYTEDDFRIYIHEGGKTFVRLKTPSAIRRLRVLNMA
ncbi:hypothetical protein SVAN01_07124 [Stagonosporopsis vannaccii]|nr:hypothetical protein SVAN01_07124 [Stagonosporopsis vannaccii]